MVKSYDVIVVGSGAGGGVAAWVLSVEGLRVLLIERGWQRTYADVPVDHLRNERLPVYGHNAGPDDRHVRVIASKVDGPGTSVLPHQPGYHNNAAAVGGGTLVYGAQAWRFMPQDFRMATTYGVPAGSSLADWPIGYDELEPYYSSIEQEMGVSGEVHELHGERQRSYPMSPFEPNPQRKVLEAAARRLGWPVAAVPLLINTRTFNGRPACGRCGMCVGFACPTDGKNGTQNTLLPRALSTGHCTLLTRTVVTGIETDARGDVCGVSVYSERTGSPIRTSIKASAVVLAGGAIESARLLLASRSKHHPLGLGNRFDLVGRNLQGHCYSGAFGLFSEDLHDGLGPGVSIATCKFNHGNDGIVGGGMLANEFIPLPSTFWHRNFPPDVSRWGEPAKRFMRDNYRRVMQVHGPVHDIPSPDARVTLDPNIVDPFGTPVARLSGTTHPATIDVARFMHERAVEWLTAAGAVKVWGQPPGLHLTGGQHQAGTCRMGTDPQTSVTDPFGRVHGHDNLFVMDGGVHVTNGGFNPVLTILATAMRSAEHLGEQFNARPKTRPARAG